MDNLLNLKVVDEIIPEPIGGAHRDRDLILENVKKSIESNLNEFFNLTGDEIFKQRKNKFLKIGRNKGFTSSSDDSTNLTVKKNNIFEILKSKKATITLGLVALILLSVVFFIY